MAINNENCHESPEAAVLPGQETEPAATTPITIITGFLGSGKTTLVNRLLTSPEHGQRLLVIENELGSVSIDHALIDQSKQASAPAGVVVLKNGCMCCSGESPGSELERVLDKLLEMSRVDDATGGKRNGHGQGARLPFDHVLVETSGMADPGPILQILCRREMAASGFYVDGVVTVVDCQNILRHLKPEGAFGFARRRVEAEKQIALADKIILNKTDLLQMPAPTSGLAAAAASDERTTDISISTAGIKLAQNGASDGRKDKGRGQASQRLDGLALSEILAAVRFVNASAPITTACRAEVPLNELLSLRAYSSAGWLNHHARHLDRAARAEKALPSSRAHSATVTCVSLVLEPPYAIELGRLQAWLQNIVTARHEDLYRLKGVLSIKGRAERFVLHGIHANVHGAFDRSWSPGEVRSSTMIVIGRKLDRAALHEGFRASAVTVDATEVDGACDECAPEETLRRRTPALSYDTQRASQRSN